MSEPIAEKQTLYLLRHGECEGGAILRGHSDVALTAKGWQQMRTAAAKVPEVAEVISSPLRRCREFAKTHAAERSRTLTLDCAWRELGFGAWDGQPLAELWQQQAMGDWWQDPWTHTPPGGEPLKAFEARLDGALGTLLARRPGTALIVCHGGVITHLLRRALGLGPEASFYRRLLLPPAALVQLDFYPQSAAYNSGGISHDSQSGKGELENWLPSVNWPSGL
ncbi:histidine phosphatase family protein [Shewanella cyperi]|uniref:histidine phosphatase family protein n=1 Tax=Shewanella cyperi TaxID=2814292 RepID=UPI001A93C722|nr:histidine phosphatase family protein [Shewanella cyperi]QSX40071.1 histidine phosphatase family protein [Shewanella cyperi]